MAKPINSFEGFQKKYLPITHEAETVARMTKSEYFSWFLKTPGTKRDRVLEVVRNIANGKIKDGQQILEMVGGL